ncbi:MULTISPECIES: hypothetical protein [unclassified Streptomyces]|uniref:hypothetical protein n=1 Tax=unclassified Streptomyces TaxID=2593676 RepID=UPI0033BF4287
MSCNARRPWILVRRDRSNGRRRAASVKTPGSPPGRRAATALSTTFNRRRSAFVDDFALQDDVDGMNMLPSRADQEASVRGEMAVSGGPHVPAALPYRPLACGLAIGFY